MGRVRDKGKERRRDYKRLVEGLWMGEEERKGRREEGRKVRRMPGTTRRVRYIEDRTAERLSRRDIVRREPRPRNSCHLYFQLPLAMTLPATPAGPVSRCSPQMLRLSLHPALAHVVSTHLAYPLCSLSIQIQPTLWAVSRPPQPGNKKIPPSSSRRSPENIT